MVKEEWIKKKQKLKFELGNSTVLILPGGAKL